MRRVHLAVAAAALGVACSGDPSPGAGIMISLATDMVVPDSINEVGLYIEHIQGARRTLVVSQEARPLYNEQTRQYELRFRASFAIEASKNPSNDSIRSRFVGFRSDGTVVAMREARVRVPERDLKSLPLPLLFVNEGRVEDTLGARVAPGSSDVGLQQLQEGARTDPFTRWRHPECALEETLGDDGECTSIDLRLEDLDSLADAERNAGEVTACLDTQACFGGERGRRELDINADCTVSAGGLGAEQLALAIRTRSGYGDVHAQPVPETLYSYDKGSQILTLKRALCARANREGIGKVLVSVKCAPMRADTTICAPWQDAPPAGQPDANASFPDEPLPNQDAGGDADANFSDASDAGPALQAFTRTLAMPSERLLDYLDTFAARPDGKVWAIVRGGQDIYTGVAAPGLSDVPLASMTEATNDLPASSRFKLELGAGSAAYAIPFSDYPVMPSVLLEAGSAFVQLELGGMDCETPGTGEAPQAFTTGIHDGQSIALYRRQEGTPLIGSIASATHPQCFPGMNLVDPADQSYGLLFRGASFAGKFRVPAYDAADAAIVAFDTAGAPAVTATPYVSPAYEPGSGSVDLQSLVDVGNGQAMLLGKGDGSAGIDTRFYVASGTGAPQAGPSVHVVPNAVPTREAFGGGDAICARLEDQEGLFHSVQCVRQATQMQVLKPAIGVGNSFNELRVYGDASYLYLAKACFESGMVTSVRVQATPWSQVGSNAADQLLNSDTCKNSNE